MSKDNVVFILPEPKPEFRNLSEEEVAKAIKSRARRNPIKAEVSRLVDQYLANFKAYIAQNGTEPFLLEIQVKTPIERLSVRLMLAALEKEQALKKPTLH